MDGNLYYDASQLSESQFSVDLISRLLLLTDENILNFRNSARIEIILAILSNYHTGETFTGDQLIKDIEINFSCKFLYEDLTVYLDQLIDKKIITFLSDKKYVLNQPIELVDFSKITETIWSDFLPVLIKEYQDFDIFLDSDAKPVFDNIILSILIHIAGTLEDLNTQVELLHEIDIQQIIDEQLINAKLTPLTTKKFPDAMKRYLLSNSENLNEFLYNAYFNIIKYKVLEHEQELDLSINPIENIQFLILDTSFLVPLLCSTDVKYPFTVSVIKKCHQYKIPLYFLPPTKNEMERLIEGSNREMQGISIGKMHSLIQTQYVEDFKNKLSSNPSSTWKDYYGFLIYWEKQLNTNYGIHLLPNEISYNLNEKVVNFVQTTLKILGRSSPEDITRNYHDGYCLGAISDIRSNSNIKKLEGKFIPMGPWFVSFDNLVARTDAIYHEKASNENLLIQPRSLLKYFMIFSKVQFDKKDKSLICEALLKQTFTKASHKVTLDQFCSLITFKFGLATQDIEVVKQIIFAHPLKDVIKKSLEYGRGDIATETIFKIISDQDFVESIVGKTEMETKYRKVLKEKISVEKERDTWKIKYIALQENLLLFTESTQQRQFLALIDLFNAEKVFDKGPIDPLPQKPTKEILFEWLRKAKETIETSETFSRALFAGVEIISFLLKNKT